MQPSSLYPHVNKMLFGALIWTLFYIYVFFDTNAWNSSLFAGFFQNSYSYVLLYIIQFVFFLLLNVNLYTYTIGKKFNRFDIHLFFKVFIYAGVLVLLTQLIMVFYDLPFHYGFIGYFLGKSSIFGFAYDSIGLYVLYMLSTWMLALYVALVLVYIFQIKKSNAIFNFTILYRFLVIILLMGIVLGTSQDGFNWIQLMMFSVYIAFSWIVYVKTKYNISALVVSLLILFLL